MQGEARELPYLGAVLAEGLSDGQRRVVDPRLVEEDALGEEPLGEHALDDLRPHVLGLRGHVGKLLVDGALLGDLLLGHLVTRHGTPGFANEMCCASMRASSGLASASAHEDADLLGGPVDVGLDDLAVLGRELGRTGDDDVLADLGHELDPLVLELLRGIGPSCLDTLENPPGEGEEVLVLGDRLGLAADRDHRARAVRRPRRAPCPR